MEILAHRGFWHHEKEKNSNAAFARAFQHGFGVETDIRDLDGELVISHDMPRREGRFTLSEFLSLYTSYRNRTTLALNIKSDGIQDQLRNILLEFDVDNYFVFDMSIPDTLGYAKLHMNFLSRHSDIEKEPLLYEESQGIWMDELQHEWIDASAIARYRTLGKKICLVSPELHGRGHIEKWKIYQEVNQIFPNGMSLCTDYPESANEFFNKNN